MGSCRSAPCARSVGWPAQRLSDLPAKIVPPLVAGDDVLARVDPRLGRLPPAALDGALLLLRLGRVLRREELVKVLRRLALPPELNRGAGLPGGLSLLELCDSVGLGRLSVREVQPARGSRGETPASSRGREREAPRARRGGSVRPERFVLQRKSLGALVLPRLSPRARSSLPRRLPRFTHEALDLLSADVLVVVLVVHRARRALLSSLSLGARGQDGLHAEIPQESFDEVLRHVPSHALELLPDGLDAHTRHHLAAVVVVVVACPSSLARSQLSLYQRQVVVAFELIGERFVPS